MLQVLCLELSLTCLLSFLGGGSGVNMPIPNFAAFQQQHSITNIELAAPRQRKRRIKAQTNIRRPSPDLNQSHNACVLAGSMTPNNVVSTGLRLALDDDLSTVTSSRPDHHVGSISASAMNIFGDDMAVHIVQQQNELNQLIKIQVGVEFLGQRDQNISFNLLNIFKIYPITSP